MARKKPEATAVEEASVPLSKDGRQVTATLPPDDFARLKIHCFQTDQKQYQVVRRAILEYLDRQG